MFTKNVLFNNRSDLEDAILDENDNSSGRYCCSRRVLIARRWKQFFDHNIHLSRIDWRRVSRRNLPWGRPFTLPWTRHRGGVLNAGNTTSSENSSVEVQSKHSPEEIPVWGHAQSSILYLSEGQNSGCQMSGSVIHIYKERLLILWFAQEFSTIGFLYLSKGLEFRLSGDGDYDSSHYKESIPYFTFAWLLLSG